MKLGLVYQDEQGAALRPLNASVVHVCRPDFVALEVDSLEVLRARVGDVQALRLVANYVLPVERMTKTAAVFVARVLGDLAPGGHLRRITIGARPADTLTPEAFLTKVARVVGEFGAGRVTLGLGDAPAA